MPRRPLVAIPTYHLADGRVRGWVRGGFGLPETYVHSVRRAGARPVLLPAPDPDDAEDLLSQFDAVVLAGGGDVDPGRYNATMHPSMYGVDTDRDTLEFDVAVGALRLGLPTLAICRGFQVVNVALGGSLHQHLPDMDNSIAHGSPVGGIAAVHDVKVAGGTRLEEVVGSVARECVSYHHQGVDRIGEGLVATAWTDDGLVEAVEPEEPKGFFVAVQWHPEMTAETDPVQQALFDALVAAARS